MLYYISTGAERRIVSVATSLGKFVGAIEAPIKPGRPRYTKSRIRKMPADSTLFSPNLIQTRALTKAGVI